MAKTKNKEDYDIIALLLTGIFNGGFLVIACWLDQYHLRMPLPVVILMGVLVLIEIEYLFDSLVRTTYSRRKSITFRETSASKFLSFFAVLLCTIAGTIILGIISCVGYLIFSFVMVREVLFYASPFALFVVVWIKINQLLFNKRLKNG